MTVLKRKLCSDTVGNKRFWKLAGDLEAGPPTRAMLRHNYRRIYLLEGLDRWSDDGLEDFSREMKSSQHGVYVFNPGHGNCMLKRIYETRVAAACQHHKTFVLHVQDHCLIIMNPRVWLPLAVNPSDLGRAPFFIGRRARNLSSDQDMSAD